MNGLAAANRAVFLACFDRRSSCCVSAGFTVKVALFNAGNRLSVRGAWSRNRWEKANISTHDGASSVSFETLFHFPSSFSRRAGMGQFHFDVPDVASDFIGKSLWNDAYICGIEGK